MSSAYFHGGKSGLVPGDLIEPAPPAHVDDNCPICVGRREGRVVTVREYRAWCLLQGPRFDPVLKALESGHPDDPVDPPRAEADKVYITTDIEYAQWYAARSRGDLYQVTPGGPLTRTDEDHFPSFTVASAVVVRVIRRNVRLKRRDRRHLHRRWTKADARADRARGAA